jgi:hypothetical protein
MTEPPESPGRLGQRPGDEFLSMVGSCITEWAHVENVLFNICWRSLGCAADKAAIVYYRSPSIETRLRLTDELVLSVLPKPQRRSGGHRHDDAKLWKSIETDFEELLPIRNQLAHHPITMVQEYFRAGDPVGTPLSAVWFEIYVSNTERLRDRSSRFKALRLADLHKHLQGVNVLTERLRTFLHWTLEKHVGSSPLPSSPLSPAGYPAADRNTKHPRRPKSSPP